MSSYDKFAQKYSDTMGEEGDYFHKNYIDPPIYELVGRIEGKAVYDIGCGNGYMARHFAAKGADTVYASDISKDLLKIAKEKSKEYNIEYSKRDANDFTNLAEGKFDVITMNMVIHYVENLDKLFAGISRILKKNGRLVFSTNHFFRPTWPYSEWTDGLVYGDRKIFIKVNGYLESKKVKIKSYWDESEELVIYNRPFNVIIEHLASNGLFISKIREQETPEFPRSTLQDLEHDHQIPTFLIVRVEKFIL